MTLEKFFAYAFLVTLPLSLLDKTTLIREYYQAFIWDTDFSDLAWIFLGLYIIVRLVNLAIEIWGKKGKQFYL